MSDLREYEGSFNTVLTQRVVINFMTWAEQKRLYPIYGKLYVLVAAISCSRILSRVLRH